MKWERCFMALATAVSLFGIFFECHWWSLMALSVIGLGIILTCNAHTIDGWRDYLGELFEEPGEMFLSLLLVIAIVSGIFGLWLGRVQKLSWPYALLVAVGNFGLTVGTSFIWAQMLNASKAALRSSS